MQWHTVGACIPAVLPQYTSKSVYIPVITSARWGFFGYIDKEAKRRRAGERLLVSGCVRAVPYVQCLRRACHAARIPLSRLLYHAFSNPKRPVYIAMQIQIGITDHHYHHRHLMPFPVVCDPSCAVMSMGPHISPANLLAFRAQGTHSSTIGGSSCCSPRPHYMPKSTPQSR